mmetsp:Transcript_8403/g.15863  ORF Transcript_8403/g.15863 Transcript_8403/m.15863 type:complete len:374 (+) Transcript_8403:107-1228(+)|eukprot:CAMPEP_0176482062 /NCGR_PEP_ID=MMETSP0200_2-20121128/3169_1 /TAXON_ID=947934 /ORGANISM="Chaetoceros sp., Strain GSL56" /LENGTH=373 /DNA_ID=CAMNT_0017878341 /DNA_START=72 /DNA_END=1193 /DNA_ORIENTATION=-
MISRYGLRNSAKQTFAYVRYLSNYESPKPTLVPNDIDKLNRTSAKLYRILLKSLRSSKKKSAAGNFNDHILLQPPLNHRDYGSAQFLRSSECTHWCDQSLPFQSDSMRQEDNRLEILSFLNWWVQNNNETFENKIVDDYVMENISPGAVANLLVKNLFVSYNDLRETVRQGFRMYLKDSSVDKSEILELQRFAIESSRILQDQIELWERTSISIDEERGLRIVATSSSIGTTAVRHLSSGQDMKNRFTYRIRIENFNLKNDHVVRDDDQTFQLLGRSWKIMEDDSDDDDAEVIVNAPTTGVVGHLPVLKPGDSFEYMSGCDLKTPRGTMTGSLHMALVDDDTASAQVGDPVDALHAPKEKLFELPVQPFRLIS